jgi:hypothetical protein
MSQQELTRARRWARVLLDDLECRRLEHVMAMLYEVTDPTGAEHALLGPLLTELTMATAEMTAAQSLAPLDKVAYRLSISTVDGAPVVVDQLDPPVRAVLRAILAQLHHSPADAREQVDLATATAAGNGGIDAVMHALLWTQHSWRGCRALGIAPPQWLSEELPA